MKLIVCESCEAEFRIKHSLDDRYYKEIYCPFCGEELQEELEDELEDFDE
jgi:DNA-directed RNA polymerase subunit RPC12/RpoP